LRGATKSPFAKERAAFVINYRTEDFAARQGDHRWQGVVVYDRSAGHLGQVARVCLRPFGLMASFGNASGCAPVRTGMLGAKGSLRDADALHPRRREG
jgi:NADPH2:quinone reductase